MSPPPRSSSSPRILIGLAIGLLCVLGVVIGATLRGTSRDPGVRSSGSPLLPVPRSDRIGGREGGSGKAADVREVRGVEDRSGSREALPLEAWRDASEAQFASPIEWSGGVRDGETEEPIEGVEILLSGGDYLGRAETDEEGEFTVRWSAGLAATLSLSHPRYIDLAAPEVVLDEPGDFALRRSGRIEGRIVGYLPDEETREEARIEAWRQTASSRRFWEALHGEIERDGSFLLSDLGEGDHAVTAVVPGSFVELKMGIHVASGETVEVMLEATAACTLFGRVSLEETGGGIEEVKLEIEPRSEGLPSEIRAFRSAETATLRDGSWELVGLAPGNYRLTACSPWGAKERREVHLPESGCRVECALEFPGPARLSGYVLDAEERGVSGATVLAFPGKDRSSRFESTRRIAEATPIAVSGANGFFFLENLPSGRPTRVVAFPPGTGPTPSGAPERPAGLPGFANAPPIAAGEEGPEVVVRLPAHHAVEGRVIALEDGNELAGALVLAEYRRGKRTVRTARVVTDEEGRFLLTPLREGEATVRVWSDGYLAQRQVVRVEAQSRVELEFALEASLSIGGVALDDDGFGVPRIPIRAEVDPEFELAEEEGDLRRRRNASTDEFGRFHFDDLFPAPWIVTGGSFEWEMREADPPIVLLPDEEWTTLTFGRRERPERFAIVGRVVLQERGVPRGVRIEGRRGGVLEVDGGRFEATGLTPTRHRLRIFAEGHVPRTVGPIEPRPGETVDIGVVELWSATRLTVKIADLGKVGDKKAKEIQVMLLPLPPHEGGIGEEGKRIPLASIGKGRYRHPFVPRFTWRLVARHPELGRYSRPIEIGEGPDQTVKIRLK
jgi:hypothetical protein